MVLFLGTLFGSIDLFFSLNSESGVTNLFISKWGFPDGSDGKESAYSAGDLGLIPGLGRSPGGRHGNPLQYSCLENPPGQRSLAGYSPRGHKDLDTTERLTRAEIYPGEMTGCIGFA